MLTSKDKLSLYISGPMRGYPHNNRDAFRKAHEKWARNPMVGFICNPSHEDDVHNIDPDAVLSQEQLKECMHRDLELLFDCNAIYMLRGWERSEGAKVEHSLAVYLKLLVLYES